MINMESITNSSKIIKNKLGENVALDIEKDFDNYFGTIVCNEIIPNLTTNKITWIILSSGPYRNYDVDINWIDKEKELIHIDYYSAVRVGFGTPHTDEVIEMLNNL